MSHLYRALVGAPFELGVRAMARTFLGQLEDARAISHATLRSILALNGATAWGRRHGLDRPDALDAFRALPPTSYQDYAPLIERIAAGEPGLLTSDPVTYFAVTSGTTGAQKLIPVTQRQTRAIMRHMQLPSGLALLSGALAPVRGRSLFIATEQISGPTSGGIPRGAATSNGLRRMGPALGWLWTSPLPVIQLQDQPASRYLHLLFALAEPHLWTITAFFPSTLLFVLRDLHARAEELLRDLADGTITRQLNLPGDLRADLGRRLRPQPARARALAALLGQGRFTARDIWPDLRVVFSVSSGAFRFYVDQLRPYLGDVRVFSAVYGASEAAIGIGLWADRPGYALTPSAAFHEFLPLGPGARPLALDEVEIGQRYELLVTTYAGLTRYRMGDIVQVIGRYGQAPVIEFIERRGQAINLIGEKTAEEPITRSFEAACRELGAQVLDYIVAPDPGVTPGRYLLLVERLAAGGPEQIDIARLLESFDRHLRAAAPRYDAARRAQMLGPMAARALPPGTFELFRAARVAAGASAAQVKVPHVVPDPSLVGQHFFADAPQEVALGE